MSSAPPLLGRLAGLVPRLPRSAWLLLAGMFSGWIAGGFVSAFLIVYLHFVRHVSLGTAGIALALVALGGSLVSPLVGSLTDRFGARRLLAMSSGEHDRARAQPPLVLQTVQVGTRGWVAEQASWFRARVSEAVIGGSRSSSTRR